MRGIIAGTAVVIATGCGRIGYELQSVGGSENGAAPGSGGASGGSVGELRGTTNGAAPGSGGAGRAGDPGGTTNDASTDSAVASGGSSAGGTSAGTGGGDADPGAGGQLVDAGGASGKRAGSDAGGAGPDGGSYTCTPGAPELCDGRDNNCDGAIDEAGCPIGCVGKAWGSHGYMLCDRTNYTWNDAKAECEGAGLELARIDSQQENDFVNGLVFASRTGEVWLGGSDVASEGQWRWPDGAQFWSGLASPSGAAVGGAYTHWYTPTEPDGQNSALSGAGNCLALIPAQGGAWVDQGCNYFRRALCRAP